MRSWVIHSRQIKAFWQFYWFQAYPLKTSMRSTWPIILTSLDKVILFNKVIISFRVNLEWEKISCHINYEQNKKFIYLRCLTQKFLKNMMKYHKTSFFYSYVTKAASKYSFISLSCRARRKFINISGNLLSS